MTRDSFLIGYCIREAGDPAPAADLEGLGGGQVRSVTVGEHGLWYSQGRAPLRELASVRTHDEVVRAALSTATPLPLRFGSIFRDLEDAQAALLQRRNEFLESFARVRGRVEMSILLTAEPLATAEAPAREVRTGRDYLELRRGELRETEAREERAERLLNQLSSYFDPIPYLRLPGLRRATLVGSGQSSTSCLAMGWKRTASGLPRHSDLYRM